MTFHNLLASISLFNTNSALHIHFLLYAFPLSAILTFTFCFLLPTNHFHFPISTSSTVTFKYEFPLFLFLIFLHSPLVFICKFILPYFSLQLFELLGVVRYQGSWQDVRRKTEQTWLFAKTPNPLLLSWICQCQICVSWSFIPIPQFGLVYFLVTTASYTK